MRSLYAACWWRILVVFSFAFLTVHVSAQRGDALRVVQELWQKQGGAPRDLADVVQSSSYTDPGTGVVQQYAVLPYFTLVRFGRWEQLLRDTLPPDTWAHPARAMPAGSTPLWFQKFWSSAAITALISTRGIRR